MTLSHSRSDDRADPRLLDEDAWEAPGRLTEAELFTHGSDGWRRNSCDMDDPEDCR